MLGWLKPKEHNGETKEETERLHKAVKDFNAAVREETRIQRKKINLVRLADEALSLNLGKTTKE